MSTICRESFTSAGSWRHRRWWCPWTQRRSRRARRPQSSCTQPPEPVIFCHQKQDTGALKDLQQSLLLLSWRLGVPCHQHLVDHQEAHPLEHSGDLGLVEGCRDVGSHGEVLKNLFSFHTKQSLLFHTLTPAEIRAKRSSSSTFPAKSPTSFKGCPIIVELLQIGAFWAKVSARMKLCSKSNEYFSDSIFMISLLRFLQGVPKKIVHSNFLTPGNNFLTGSSNFGSQHQFQNL